MRHILGNTVNGRLCDEALQKKKSKLRTAIDSMPHGHQYRRVVAKMATCEIDAGAETAR